MLNTILQIIQIIIAISLIVVILLQAKGVGLGATFGGEGSFYRSRRGVEKLLLYLTIAFSTLFAAVSIIGVVISS
ncbi:MAG TPA: preprotein translocase subunit SecG [Patescibacteria group bacterium]